MKFLPETIQILKNFNTIHQSIVIDEGNILSTTSPSKNIVAIYESDQTFKQQFGIYEISKFLNTLSLFQDPEIDFVTNKLIHIKEGRTVVKYSFAEPSLIQKAPKGLKELDSIVTFEISQDIISNINKAASILGLTDITVQGNGKNLLLGASGINGVNDTYNIEVGETDQTFKANIKVEYLKLINDTYNCSINDRAFIFKSTNRKLMYWIARETNSKIGS